MDDFNQTLCLMTSQYWTALHFSSLAELFTAWLTSEKSTVCSYGERNRLLQLALKSHSRKLRRNAESDDDLVQLKATLVPQRWAFY